MEEKAQGIVLGGIKYGESDMILSVFTLEKGLVSSGIKGVKKAGAKLKFASEPFCFAEFVFSNTHNRRTVIGASLTDSFYPLREDIKKFFSASSCLEFVKKFYKEEIVSSETFFLLANTLKQTAYGENCPVNYLLAFLLDGLRLAGYGLNLGDCSSCGETIEGKCFFSADTGSFYCKNCVGAGSREIDLNTLKSLIKVKNGEKIAESEGIKPLKLLQFYMTNKTGENFTSLKSLIEMLGVNGG